MIGDDHDSHDNGIDLVSVPGDYKGVGNGHDNHPQARVELMIQVSYPQVQLTKSVP